MNGKTGLIVVAALARDSEYNCDGRDCNSTSRAYFRRSR